MYFPNRNTDWDGYYTPDMSKPGQSADLATDLSDIYNYGDSGDPDNSDRGFRLPSSVAENGGTRRLSTPEDVMKRDGSDVYAYGDSGVENDGMSEQLNRAPSTRPAIPSKERSAYDDYIATVGHPPKEPKPGIWRTLGAMALGGAAGFLNASGRTRPVDVSGATDRILHGDYRDRYREWQQDVAHKQQAAQIEGKRNVDVNADRRLDQAYDTAAERERHQREMEKAAAITANSKAKDAEARTIRAKAAQEKVNWEKERTDVELKRLESLGLPPDKLAQAKQDLMLHTQRRINVILKGADAEAQVGIISPEDAKKIEEERRATEKKLSDSKANLNDRKPGTGNGGTRRSLTPEERAQRDTAKGAIRTTQSDIAKVEKQIQALEQETNHHKAIVQNYNEEKTRNPDLQLSPDKIVARNKEYNASRIKLDQIHGEHDSSGKQITPGQYAALQARKKQLYAHLQDLQARFTGNPDWAQPDDDGVPDPASVAGSVAPPPVPPPPPRRSNPFDN